MSCRYLAMHHIPLISAEYLLYIRSSLEYSSGEEQPFYIVASKVICTPFLGRLLRSVSLHESHGRRSRPQTAYTALG